MFSANRRLTRRERLIQALEDGACFKGLWRSQGLESTLCSGFKYGFLKSIDPVWLP